MHICIYIYIYIYIMNNDNNIIYYDLKLVVEELYIAATLHAEDDWDGELKAIVAIFYPFSQFCEINISLLSLQTQPNTAPNLFQIGVEYGKYEGGRQDLHGGGAGDEQ